MCRQSAPRRRSLQIEGAWRSLSGDRVCPHRILVSALHVRDAQREPLQSDFQHGTFPLVHMRRWSGCGTNSMSCRCSKLKIEAIESLGFLASKHASRLPPISPHAWPSSCPGCRESDILISKPSEASTIGGIGRVGSHIRCLSIRLPPTKHVYAHRSIRVVRG